MRRPGRNDPCACGSRKKYKHCCLPREEEVQAGVRTLSRRFEEGDYEQRIIAVRDALEKNYLLDAELVIDVMLEIWSETRSRGEYSRVVELLEELQRRAPDVYEVNREWYDKWLIQSNVALGHFSDLPRHLSFYARGQGDADLFFQIIDLLMYHDLRQPLMDAMQQAWPSIRDTTTVMPWGVDEFADTLTVLNLFDHIERVENPDADDPALRNVLSPFFEADPSWLRQVLDHLLGRAAPAWTLQNFVYHGAPRASEVEGQLYFLSLHVLRDLHQGAGMSWGRAEMGRSALGKYLLSDPHVEAQDRHSPFLYPHPRSLDRFLADYFDLINPQPYRAGALVEALPRYLDFLYRNGMMDASGVAATVRSLHPVASDVVRVLESGSSDPTMIRAVRSRWEREA